MIRPAVPSDAAKAMPLILSAIGHIAFVLAGTADTQEAVAILTAFFGQEDNRLCYRNTLVTEEEGDLIGLAILYDGAQARALDLPLERAAARKLLNSNYRIPTEPELSDYYLDTLSVAPSHQGKGHGRRLIEAGCERARALGHHRLALLVEVESVAIKGLYQRVGFRAEFTKWIGGHEYIYMARSF
jgi:ribosomal protein S18 acetylase RimI-like enzyme